MIIFKILYLFLTLFVLKAVAQIYTHSGDIALEENTVEAPETDRSVPKSAQLLLVQLLFRHGDRSPTFAYKTDPNPVSFWEEGLGRLTKLGRKQHYELGKYLRNRYKDFATFSPVEVNVTSTDYDRTLLSAESHLAGLFAPTKEWKIDDDLNWQPLPIHHRHRKDDRYLLPNTDCPRAFQEAQRPYFSKKGQNFLREHAETFRLLSEHSGEKNLDVDLAAGLFDTIKIEKKYGLIVPKWIEPLWKEMEQVTDESYSWWFRTPVLKRLRTGPLVKLIIENMKRKIDGESPNLKFQIYSAHDLTVAMALTALDVFNNKQPPYCATVVYELHGMDDGSHAMRLLYFNSTEPEKKIEDPHILTIPGCSEFCPIDYIIKYVKDIVIDGDQLKNECKVETL